VDQLNNEQQVEFISTETCNDLAYGISSVVLHIDGLIQSFFLEFCREIVSVFAKDRVGITLKSANG
jgi:hypothetical protein